MLCVDDEWGAGQKVLYQLSGIYKYMGAQSSLKIIQEKNNLILQLEMDKAKQLLECIEEQVIATDSGKSTAVTARLGQSYRARTNFIEIKGKFRERHYYSLKKMNVCTNSLAVHGLKITTTDGIFCKERRSLMKKYMHSSAKYGKGNKKF